MELKYATELFLGKYELQRLKESLDDNGFREFLLDDSLSFGLIKNTKDNTFSNGLVEVGSNVGTIKHSLLKAIDKNGKLIYKTAEDLITLTDNNLWYWVKIKHQYSSQELGTVSVDNSGNLTGVGTEFLKTLRGQPEHPTKIKFLNAVNNTLEYEVLDVVSDTVAVLNSITSTEIDLYYGIIGTFTPGKVISAGDKYPIQFDDCTLSLILEVVPDVAPTVIIDEEFYLARVKRNGAAVTIQDKRINYIWETRADYVLRNLFKPTTGAIPVIGIEAIKYDYSVTPRDKNIIYIGWSFRSTNWTVNTNINTVTLNAGEGGRYKTNVDFTSGEFNGWRLYVKDGTYYKIISSTKVGGAINLVLDSLDYKKFSVDLTQELIITPDAEEIEIIFVTNPGEGSELPDKRFVFNINKPYGKCDVLVYAATGTLYNVRFRFKQLGQYSQIQVIPSDTTNGFYNENQFTDKGVIVGFPVRSTYVTHLTNGFIPLILSSIAYVNFNLGDLLGIEDYILTNTTPKQIYVGTNKQHFIISGSPVLAQNNFINLNKLSFSGGAIRNGNKFWIQLKCAPTLGAFTFKIVQDYVDPVTFTLLKDIDLSCVEFISNTVNGIILLFEFDGVNWRLAEFNEVDVYNDWRDVDFADLTIEAYDTGGVYTAATFGASPAMKYKKIGNTIHLSFDDIQNIGYDCTPNTLIGFRISGLTVLGLSPVGRVSGTIWSGRGLGPQEYAEGIGRYMIDGDTIEVRFTGTGSLSSAIQNLKGHATYKIA